MAVDVTGVVAAAAGVVVGGELGAAASSIADDGSVCALCVETVVGVDVGVVADVLAIAVFEGTAVVVGVFEGAGVTLEEAFGGCAVVEGVLVAGTVFFVIATLAVVLEGFAVVGASVVLFVVVVRTGFCVVGRTVLVIVAVIGGLAEVEIIVTMVVSSSE